MVRLTAVCIPSLSSLEVAVLIHPTPLATYGREPYGVVQRLAQVQYDDRHSSVAATLQVNLAGIYLKNRPKLIAPTLGKVSWSSLHQLILYIALGLHWLNFLYLLSHHSLF